MNKQKIDFFDVVGDIKQTCNECEALIEILKAFCEHNEGENQVVYYIFVLIEILSDKNSELNNKINLVERFSRFL